MSTPTATASNQFRLSCARRLKMLANPPQPVNARAFIEHLVKFFVVSLLERGGLAHALNLQQKGRRAKPTPSQARSGEFRHLFSGLSTLD